MSDKAIYSVDTVETITDNDKIYVNTGDNIKQIKSSDLFIDINSNLIGSKNSIIDYSSRQQNKGINENDGLIIAYSGTYVIANIKVVKGVNYKLSGTCDVYCYSNSAYLGKSRRFSGVTSFKVESDVDYVQIEASNSVTNLTMISDGIGKSVAALNESLADYGLDNKLNGLQNGYYDGNTGEYNPISSQGLCNTNPIKATQGQIITIKHDYAPSQFGMGYFTSSGYGGELQPTKISANEYKVIAPSNCASIVFNSVFDKPVTPQTIEHIGVYVDNQIDVLKNDLSSLGCEIAFGDVDFNNLTNKMVYAINGTCTNAPKTTPIHGILIVFKASNDIISQLYHDSDGTLYNRMYWGGTWGSWK